MDKPPLPTRSVALALALALALTASIAHADPGPPPIALYWYGTVSDGDLWRETAFSTWYVTPKDIPLVVRNDYLGIALANYPPGSLVRITAIALPLWSWPELQKAVIGQTVIARVVDRPGSPTFADAWPATFQQLAPLWVGRLEVVIESAESALWKRRNYQ